jgi:hypothetical protein
MSNKKLFGIVFFILSCCEFGQFAYSKNISVSAQPTKFSNAGVYCYEEQTLSSDLAFKGKSSSYSLPR